MNALRNAVLSRLPAAPRWESVIVGGSLILSIVVAVALIARPGSEASPERVVEKTTPARYQTSNWSHLAVGTAHERQITHDRNEKPVIAASFRRQKLMDAFHGVCIAEGAGEDLTVEELKALVREKSE